ncbi:MAG: hypothetical protein HETSPECPRED_003225 [Heterodermia speciosa]|uniref:TPR-like protein n=1 Tax=Heterodermia speciosa TaxID=116794 RepID=A0A8H3J626_9LECA|nr:MAG: hypothetical protein HETSPECPRED_003225 [Heterodermia speciosa]
MSEITLQDLHRGDYQKILQSSTARKLWRDGDILDSCIAPKHGEGNREYSPASGIITILEEVGKSNIGDDLFLIGCAALLLFLQANVTGPPLSWNPATTVFSESASNDFAPGKRLHAQLVASLSVDGEAAYSLMPYVELFCIAKLILNNDEIHENITTEQLKYRTRVNFWHQRLLSDLAPTLQEIIYRDLDLLEKKILSEDRQARAEFLVERASIHLYHGYDVRARDDLAEVTRLRRFEFALTGRLGKRTKFQEKELSQLVVLAKSAEYDQVNGSPGSETNTCNDEKVSASNQGENNDNHAKPVDLRLNDDTLLETISFSNQSSNASVQTEESISMALKSLNPADQPVLDPVDSIILLATASSITNTSPQDGLTREETLPYVSRVLVGGSTNWQVYSQALIVRSRIEGYRSRTTERGLLQLQAIVDQVIAETTSSPTGKQPDSGQEQPQPPPTTFLPQPESSESAPVSERLRYIHLLASPTRWKLESELADRWVSLGGLRSALEIYERLQMWAEVALCWAAQDREDKARQIVRQQLYISSSAVNSDESKEPNGIDVNSDEQTKERDPLPNDAPRLFCILGDMGNSIAAYERAWEVSKFRYARAQRSLGKHYFANQELGKADQAYAKSLKINPQNHSIWFALGCVRLQLKDWTGAVDAFGRALQIEEKDAESWSNLAAALLRLAPEQPLSESNRSEKANSDDNEVNLSSEPHRIDPQKRIREAFAALKRAASLKRDSYRIWQNLLHVSVQLSPPPYTDIIIAQTRLIDLLSTVEGEKCIDIPIVEGLVAHLIATSPTTNSHPEVQSDNLPTNSPTNQKLGFEKMLIDLVQKKITPLITSSRRLWLLTAKLSLHLKRPSATLAAYEKAWRVTLNQPGWESGTKEAEGLWREVAEATGELVDAYESLGERKREGGLGEGEVVAKDWRFKARSAVRGVIGRAKEGWEGSEEMDGLRGRMEELRVS